MNELTIPIPVLRDMLRLGRRPLRLPASWNRWGEHRELLARPMTVRSPHIVACWIGEVWPRASEVPPQSAAILLLGEGARRGQVIGALRGNDAWLPLERLKLLGP